MKKIIPFNTIGGGICRCIKAQYSSCSAANFNRTDRLGATAILEVEMKEPRIIQIGSYSPSSSCNAKVLDVDGICPTLLDHKGAEPAVVMPVSCAMRGRNPRNPSDRQAGIDTEQRLEIGGDVANCITSVQKDSMVAEPKIIEVGNYKPSGHACGKVVSADGISPTVMENHGCVTTVAEPHCLYDNQFGDFAREPIRGLARTLKAYNHNAVLYNFHIRKLTPRECFRLMDVDDADIDKIDAYRIKTTLKDGTVKEKPIPKSQKYKLAGNSIVVSCLYHIFKGMFIDEKPKLPPKQFDLFDDLWQKN